jgi:hypothetical protein
LNLSTATSSFLCYYCHTSRVFTTLQMGCLPMGFPYFLSGLFAILSLIPCYAFVYLAFYLTDYFKDPHNVTGGPTAMFKHLTSKGWDLSVHHLFTLNMMGRYIMNFLVVWTIRELAQRAIPRARKSILLLIDIAFYFGFAYLITGAIASQIAGQTLHLHLEEFYMGKKTNNVEMQREAEDDFVDTWNFLYRGIFGGYSLFCSSLWWSISGWVLLLGFIKPNFSGYSLHFGNRTQFWWKVLAVFSIIIGATDYFYWVSFVSPTELPHVTLLATTEIWVHLLIVPLWNLLAGIIVLRSKGDAPDTEPTAVKSPAKQTPKRSKKEN